MVIVNNIKHSKETVNDTIPSSTPGCTNTANYKKSTAFIDSTALLIHLQQEVVYKLAQVQESTKTLGTPNVSPMYTNKTIELLLPKLPPMARKGYTVLNIPNNLVSVAKLCDADCNVFFHKHGVDIGYNGKVIDRGWHSRPSRL